MTWNIRVLLGLLALAALLMAACGEDVAEPPGDEPEPTEEPAEPDDRDEAEDAMVLTGTFTGDPQLEGGCAWVETDDGTRYEVMWPQGYEVTWHPLELRGPDGAVVARDGDEVRVSGTVAEDMASICMVGPIVQADTVEGA
jgi:hypothetical protein